MALQVTSGSRREKWVAAFIPANAILLIGFLYITLYAMPEFNKTETEFDRAVSNFVGPGVIQELEAESQQLRVDRAELKRTISSFDDEVTEKSEAFQQLPLTAKHRAVTALCRKHSVAVLQDQPVDSITLPTLRRKSVETLQSLVSKESISFRELTVAGDYATIVALLQELPEVLGVIPVSVTLKKAKQIDSSSRSTDPAVSWTVGLLM
ncbi:MAG: hypothetical protein MK110_19490 [Fuerstiella sp.]|nr:hypothetical protein [Fuerstiella sp.]